MDTLAKQFGQAINAERQERRASPRTPFRAPVRVTINPPPGREADTARYVHVLGNDLSACGVSIIYSRNLQIGQEIELEMPDTIRAAVVRRVERKPDGRYLIGCQFVDRPAR